MENEYAKALIYYRVSSDKQVKEGSGLDSQEHRGRLDAESVGLEVEEVFREEGISGGLFDRPTMTALLNNSTITGRISTPSSSTTISGLLEMWAFTVS